MLCSLFILSFISWLWHQLLTDNQTVKTNRDMVPPKKIFNDFVFLQQSFSFEGCWGAMLADSLQRWAVSRASTISSQENHKTWSFLNYCLQLCKHPWCSCNRPFLQALRRLGTRLLRLQQPSVAHRVSATALPEPAGGRGHPLAGCQWRCSKFPATGCAAHRVRGQPCWHCVLPKGNRGLSLSHFRW